MSVYFRYTGGMNEKSKRGRPLKPPGTHKREYLDVRLDASEKEAFRDAADVAGLPLSAWVRERLRRAAMQELDAVGKQIAFLRNTKLE